MPHNSAVHVEVTMTPESAGGVYSDFTRIWKTDNTFVLDFLQQLDAGQNIPNPETGVTHVHLPAALVSRVRIPAGHVIELLRALSTTLAEYDEAKAAAEAAAQANPDVPFTP